VYLDEQGNPKTQDDIQPISNYAIPLDTFMGMNKNESVLDKMQEKESEMMEELKNQLVYPGTDNPGMPPEIANKTVAQLKAMGATEIGSLDLNNQVGRAY